MTTKEEQVAKVRYVDPRFTDRCRLNVAVAKKPPIQNIVAISEETVDEQKMLERIRRNIESPPENSKVFTVTPKIAEALLRDYNFKNRPKK